MKFEEILNEVFSAKSVNNKSYYDDNKKKKKNKPERYEPYIVVPDINKTTPTGALKKKKK